jgi:hypothetical protein
MTGRVCLLHRQAHVADCGPARTRSAPTQEYRDSGGFYEVSIPSKTLGLHASDGQRMQADIGILRGNGTETTVRSYWSNKATGITADVPSEAAVTPHLLGTVPWTIK